LIAFCLGGHTGWHTRQPGRNNLMAHQFIIPGMHRSGTSLAAALLRSMGVKAGQPEMLLPSADENPKGFRECRDAMQLNAEIRFARHREVP
jgi:hypothetical protein